MAAANENVIQNLSEDEKEHRLHQFEEIVGKDDTEECRRILIGHSWNLEASVQSVFNENEGLPPVYEQVDIIEAQASTNHHNLTPFSVGQTPVAVNQRTAWLSWLQSIVLFPFTVAHITYAFSCHALSEFVTFIIQLISPSYRRAITNPVDDVTQFKSKYEDLHGPRHPTFYMGSYNQVLQDARKELKFVLVYLHCADHQDTYKFCREVLSNEAFIECVNTNTLFWACEVKSNEGYRVSRAMRETMYPFLAMVCLREERMTIVWRVQGFMPVDSLITILSEVIEENEASLVAARAERNERYMSQVLRNEQDAAFQESLAQDRMKAEQKEKEKEDRRMEERRRIEKENEKEAKTQAVIKRRNDARQIVTNSKEPLPSDEDAIMIRVKLPNGQQLKRHFLKTDSLQFLYDYVTSNDSSPHSFVLSTNFPKNTFHLQPNISLQDVGIHSSTGMFVQSLDEDSSDGEE